MEPDEAGLPPADADDLHRTVPPGSGSLPLFNEHDPLWNGPCAGDYERDFDPLYLGDSFQGHAYRGTYRPGEFVREHA
ncbi:hypothetical protein D3C73_1455170 [compost metagenome]